MTVAELYKQVAQLGFEDSLEDDDRFYFAANRALLQVNEVRPAISYYLINHKPLKNLLTDSTFDPVEKDDDLLYSAEGAKSYYFEADGNGVVYIEKHTDDGWSMIDMVQLESARQFVAYRGFIKEAGEFVGGLVRLRFTGEFLYTVKNVALYGYSRIRTVYALRYKQTHDRFSCVVLPSDKRGGGQYNSQSGVWY